MKPAQVYQMRVESVSALPGGEQRPSPEVPRRELFDLAGNAALYIAGILTGAVLFMAVDFKRDRDGATEAVVELKNTLQKGFVILPVVRGKE